MSKPLHIQLISNPIAPIQSGEVGGVRAVVCNAWKSLTAIGHRVEILAPEGSRIDDLTIRTIPGALQPSIPESPDQFSYPIQPDSFLANACRIAWEEQDRHDLILNVAYDWLPFYLVTFFSKPLLHLVVVASVNQTVDQAIQQAARQFPQSVAVQSRRQAEDLRIADCATILTQGVSTQDYPLLPKPPGRNLAFLGRIAPEKGLADAAEIARRTGHRLLVGGFLQDPDYLASLTRTYGETIVYRGFLSQTALIELLAESQALLLTTKCIEAFGMVVAEALSCGVPVIAYARGGPEDMIRNGENGFLVTPDDLVAACEAVTRLEQLDPPGSSQRARNRHEAQARFSLSALGTRYADWFKNARRLRSA